MAINRCCPSCQVDFTVHLVGRNLYAEAAINNAMVQCDEKMCAASGTNEEMAKHQCPFRHVRCVLDKLGCTWAGYAVDVGAHGKKIYIVYFCTMCI